MLERGFLSERRIYKSTLVGHYVVYSKVAPTWMQDGGARLGITINCAFLMNATGVPAGQSTPRTARDVGVICTSPPKACSESDESSAGTSCSATAHVPLLDGNHKTIGHQKLSSQAI